MGTNLHLSRDEREYESFSEPNGRFEKIKEKKIFGKNDKKAFSRSFS